MRKLILLSLLLTGIHLSAQECLDFDKKTIRRLEQHIRFLASDRLEGRAPGTEGERLAMTYLEEQFRQLGLTPLGTKGFYQPFEIPDLAVVKRKAFTIKEKDTVARGSYYPVSLSSNGTASGKTIFVGFGINAPELDHNDFPKIKEGQLKGRIAVMDVGAPDGIHPHSKYLAYHDLTNRLQYLVDQGVSGVVLISLEDAYLPKEKFEQVRACGVPVVALKDRKLAKKIRKNKMVSLEVQLFERTLQATNVVGFLDNGAPFTVVIGAHFDHLGYGSESSLYRGEPAIHNGADDNASGTAGLIELAAAIQRNREKFSRYNYLFIGFSAEEKGLLGSNHYVKNPTTSLKTVNCMINMDMIGRLDKENTIAISGTGTSPAWRDLIKAISCTELKTKTSESGVGPSDHTSFYHENIPVLHFFTGTHEDYHKPTDDAEKINFRGEADVLYFIENLLYRVAQQDRMEFTRTRDQDSESAPRFSVTLGIMPDYVFDGEGVRVEGVTEGKPASKAGLMKGDIITKLGEVPVRDMMGYMKALGSFKAGDKAALTYIRNGKTMETEVQF